MRWLHLAAASIAHFLTFPQEWARLFVAAYMLTALATLLLLGDAIAARRQRPAR